MTTIGELFNELIKPENAEKFKTNARAALDKINQFADNMEKEIEARQAEEEKVIADMISRIKSGGAQTEKKTEDPQVGQRLHCIFCGFRAASFKSLQAHSATCESHPAVAKLRNLLKSLEQLVMWEKARK